MIANQAMTSVSQPQAVTQATCPLCGEALAAQQDWCLRCGGAARTRLSASPGWRTPLVLLTIVVVLSLGVLGAALVDLAGKSNAPTTTTETVPAVTSSTPAVTTPAATNTITSNTATSGALTTPTASTPKSASPTAKP